MQIVLPVEFVLRQPRPKKILPPEKYPIESHYKAPDPPLHREANVRFLRPVQQMFKWLIAAVLFAAHNVREGVWNKGVMDVYLRTCAIATSVRENLWRVAK